MEPLGRPRLLLPDHNDKADLMKFIVKAVAISAFATLSACGGGADDRAAANVEAAAENQSDALEAAADNAATDEQHDALEAQADNVKEAGEDKAEAIDDKDDARLENAQ